MDEPAALQALGGAVSNVKSTVMAVEAAAVPCSRQREKRRTLLSIAGLWLSILLLSTALLSGISSVRQSVMRHAEERAASLARLVATHTQSIFDTVDLTLVDLADDVDPAILRNGGDLPEAARQGIERNLVEHQRRFPKIVSLSLTDRSGRVVANTAGTPAGSMLADRSYFVALKNGDPGPVISEALKGRVSGKWGIQIARPVRFSDGSFAGMLVANLGLDEGFAQYFRSFRIGEDSMLALRDTTNHLLFRSPPMEYVLGKTMGASAMSEAILRGTDEEVLLSVSPYDQQLRISAVRKLENYPIYATAGMTLSYVLQDYTRERNWAVLFIALSCLGGMALTRLLLRQDALHQDLTLAHRELSATNEELQHSLQAAEICATRDQLTGLLNRRAFNRRLEESIARSGRAAAPFSLLLLDLDHFKAINDRHGHPVGDLVLQDFAHLLASRQRATDVLARWGGEEFALIAEGTDLAAARGFAEELRSLVAAHPFPGEETLTVSCGVVEFSPGETGSHLVSRADTALYRAKNAGRNRVAY